MFSKHREYLNTCDWIVVKYINHCVRQIGPKELRNHQLISAFAGTKPGPRLSYIKYDRHGVENSEFFDR